ncbi:ABC transporter substrate-binding protein [Acrocarpospora sp. B8E8]|uniref:ABC transporter substrate-binding protein n=1 Tax=Acrocarpospora sp. B8E8 TaxID=3153572 RepID=UPI00325E2E68
MIAADQRRLHGVLEGLLRRPSFWRRDPALPVLLLVGEQSPATALALAEPFKGSLPYAAPAGEELKDVAALVNALAGENGDLGASVGGSFLPAPRFPLAQFVLWAREQRALRPEEWTGVWPPAPESRKGQDEFRARYRKWRWERYGERRVRRTAADFVVRAATTWVPLGMAVALLAGWDVVDLLSLIPWVVGLIVAAAGTAVQAALSIRGTFFSGWFRRHRYENLRRKRFESRHKYALRLAAVPDLDKLLVYAMFQDLRQAYQKWFIPWPSWGRGWYCLLVLAEPGAGGTRFLSVMRDVIADTGVYPPMIVLAAGDAPLPATPPVRPLERLPEAIDDWRAQVPDLFIPVTVNESELSDIGAFRPTPLRAFGYWAVVALLAFGPLAVVGRTWIGCGGGLREVAGQCVGLSDDLNEIDPDPLLAPVLERIQRQNRDVEDGQRVITVFYLGPLTTNRSGGDQISGSMGELAGIAARQLAYNRLHSWQIRVEFANAGQDFVSAAYAAQMIKDRAAGDPDIAGAIGFAWSRTETQDAIRLLSDAHMPMLSTTNTADTTPLVYGSKPSPSFFRMAAPNSAQAKAAEYWLQQGLPGGTKVPTDKVAILLEVDELKRELYSQDLADGLTKRPEALYAKARQYVFRDGDQLAAQVDQACQDGAAVLFYTGRSSYLGTLMDTKEHQCDGAVRVLAGDEVTGRLSQILADGSSVNNPEISFIALNDARAEQDGSGAINDTQREIEAWIRDVLPARGRSVSRVHARMGYDALLAITSAIDQIKATNVDPAVNIAQSVAYNLRGLGVDGHIQGATGSFYFSTDADFHTALPRELWLFSSERGQAVPVLRGKCTVDSNKSDPAELDVSCTTEPATP